MSALQRLPRSTPEALGIPSPAIHAFVSAVERRAPELHSLMIVRHGQVAAEGWWRPFRAAVPHVLFSLSKSYASTAVGLAVAEGLLSVDDPVIKFFPDDLPAEVSPKLAAMKVRHLLSMSTGHDADTTEFLHQDPEGNWARAFLARPVVHEPGSYFLYNSGATYMCSAIVQKLTGQRIVDYLGPRLFAPLGIEGATWQTCPRGVNTGGWGLSVRTEDIACFGQLYLQKGVWNGQQLVDPAWIAEATRKQVRNDNETQTNPDWRQGYGYQFWRCRHNCYRGDGAFGQYCIVMPDQDAVIAITSGVKDMQAVLDCVWEILLPAMEKSALAENPVAQRALADRLENLSLATPMGMAGSPVAPFVAGARYQLAPNDLAVQWVALDVNDAGGALTLRDSYGQHQVALAAGRWLASESTFSLEAPARHGQPHNTAPQPIAAAGAWAAPDTYVARIWFTLSPFSLTLTLRFSGDAVTVEAEGNVSFGPTALPTLKGVRA